MPGRFTAGTVAALVWVAIGEAPRTGSVVAAVKRRRLAGGNERINPTMERRVDRRRRGAVLAAVVLAIALASVGCGQGGDPSAHEATTAQSKPLTKRTLIAKADAICVANRRAYRAITQRFYPAHSPVSDIEEKLPNQGYSYAMLALAGHLVRQLRSLAPPPNLRARYRAYVAAQEEVRQLVLEAREASIADDGGAYLKAWKTRDAGALERFFLASTVGLRRCSPNPYGPAAEVPRPPSEPDERLP